VNLVSRFDHPGWWTKNGTCLSALLKGLTATSTKPGHDEETTGPRFQLRRRNWRADIGLT
jgi:hypothetical protein